MARRATMHKATFSLPEEVLEGVRRSVESGLYSSQNEMVRAALQRELREARERRLEDEFARAAQDPRFVKDIEDTMRAFAPLDAETARMIPE